MPYVENLGSGGGTLDAQYGSSSAPNTNAPLLLDPRTSGNFVYTPGSAGNYVSVPHADSLNILGTEGTKFLSTPGNGVHAESPSAVAFNPTTAYSVSLRLSADNWQAGSDQVIIARSTFADPNRHFALVLTGTGTLRLETTPTGSFASYVPFTSAVVPFTNGLTYWLRVSFDGNVSGNSVCTFEWAADSPTEPTLWTLITQTAPVAGQTYSAITAPLVLSRPGGQTMVGRYFRAIYRVGVSTVLDADFTQQTIGSRGFIESTGKLVTLTGAAAQIVDGTTYGFMPGVTGGWTTPNVAALNVSDLEITARVSLNDWTPAANQVIVARFTNTGPSRSYICQIAGTTGRMFVQYTLDGTTVLGQDWGGTASPFTNGQTYWLRYRRIAATGVWRFDWAPDSETEPTVWTNVGGDRAGTAGALFDATTAPTSLGAFNEVTTGNPAAGRFFRAIIRNANTGGTKVLDADFTRQIQFAGSFTEATGKVVTTQGAARIERARDLEIVTRVAADDWAITGVLQTLVAKDNNVARSYRLRLIASGAPELIWFPTGLTASALVATATDVISAADGATIWLKATLNVDDGANRTVSFYTAPDSPTEPTVWTPLGSAVSVAGSTSIGPTTSIVSVGTYGDGSTQPLAGKVYRTIIRNGIAGPAVLDLDFTSQITTGSQSVIEPASGATIPEAVQFAPNLGTGGAALNARYGASVLPEPTTNDPLHLEHTGTNYLYLPGVSGNHCEAPDLAAYNITGDIEIVLAMAMDDWTPSAVTDPLVRGVADPNIAWWVRVNTNGTVQFRFFPTGSLASQQTRTSTVAVPFADGALGWVKITLDVDNGAGGHDVVFWTSTDGTTWAQLGTTVTTAGTTSLPAVTAPLRVFRGDIVGATPFAGKVYRAQIRNGIAGTVVFDADFTTGITSGAQTTFTESSSNAATVTITRATSGRKSVAVVRDVWLFGTDDYMEVPDNDLLDFGASDSFTVVAVVRQWATISTGSAIIAKASSNSNSATAARYLIRNGTSNTSYLILDDGVNIDSLEGTVTNTPGALSVIGESVTTSTIQPYLNGVAGSSSARAAGNLANSQPLSIARFASTGYADMELLAAAIFRRALTASEIALVNTHYQTGPTAASNALLSESVWWIDAGRTAAAQINRSTTGRKSVACADCIWLLGTDDFFEVADNPLLDFDQVEDFTLLSLVRVWDFQGTNDALIAKSSSNTAGAAGYGLATGGSDPLTTTARLGDGSTGASVSTLARVPSRLVAVWAWRDTPTGTLHISLNNAPSTSTPDLTTGNSGNSLALRLGALSGTASEFLNGELKSTAIWRRTLTASERAAVNNYYGTV